MQTARALENFRISGQTLGDYPDFVAALAIGEDGRGAGQHGRRRASSPRCATRSTSAGKAIVDGRYHDQFEVDLYQGGAGTSTNMNANEVMANVALELTGHKKGEYSVIEPHDHLNMSQSTNDAYPTALKVAILRMNDKLVPALEELALAFRAKGDAFLRIVKMGRTEMQDAVPMTVGQEFHAFAAGLEAEIALLREAERAPLRREHGRHRDRHRAERAEGLCEAAGGAPREADRQADRARDRHDRGHVGSPGVPGLLGGAAQRRDQARRRSRAI